MVTKKKNTNKKNRSSIKKVVSKVAKSKKMATKTKKSAKKIVNNKKTTVKSKSATSKSTKQIKKPISKKVTKPVAKKIIKKITKKGAVKPIPKIVNKAVKITTKKIASSPSLKSIKTAEVVLKTIPKKSTMNMNISQQNKIMSQEPVDFAPIDQTVLRKPTTLLGALEFTPYLPKENETYMNEHQREHFRKILMAWKQQLMSDVDTTVGHLKEEAVFYADPVDRASQEEGFNLELRTRDRERRLIKKIEQSLDLLVTNEYGLCEDCGAEIGIRRLEARPTAVKCIDCKTFQEIREKQLGG
ncbi:MAG: RNA polymerase-binding protein DksA [uncultured bacterium]|nr:MAG: RNA polymerase-binding protein DksA [uncultured bacterium]